MGPFRCSDGAIVVYLFWNSHRVQGSILHRNSNRGFGNDDFFAVTSSKLLYKLFLQFFRKSFGPLTVGSKSE